MKRKYNFVQILLALFFLFFPVIGLLVFWNDAHSKIEKSAVNFVDESFDLFLKSLGDGKPNDDASLVFDAGFSKDQFKKLSDYRGHLGVTPIKSWAREENDQMAQYASLTVEAKYRDHTQNYKVVIRRLTVAPRWRYYSIEPSTR